MTSTGELLHAQQSQSINNNKSSNTNKEILRYYYDYDETYLKHIKTLLTN